MKSNSIKNKSFGAVISFFKILYSFLIFTNNIIGSKLYLIDNRLRLILDFIKLYEILTMKNCIYSNYIRINGISYIGLRAIFTYLS